MCRTVDQVISRLAKPIIGELPAPPYHPPTFSEEKQDGEGSSSDVRKVALAVSSMATHMTDEGWQVMQGLEGAGWSLAGHGITTSASAGAGWMTRRPDMVNVPEIVDFVRPHTLILQDKREWDLAKRDFRDPRARFTGVGFLRDRRDIFKLTVLKDAHQRPEYHRESAGEIGCHAWITYYHPRTVHHLAPYVRSQHLVRTWHSLDPYILPPPSTLFSSENNAKREGCLLSGAVNSNVYPLRKRLVENVHRLHRTTLLSHPGYGRTRCHTPDFLRMLCRFRVAICTSSVYGYALRKIAEATAAGCTVITDLPSDEAMPEIDGNLHRVPVDSTPAEVASLTRRLCDRWDPERQAEFSRKARAWYDFREVGKRLDRDIESLRQEYDRG